MKKLLTLLTLFITLTFSNSTFALDWFLDSDQARCNITYTKSNLNNDFQKDKYLTTQFDLAYNPDGGWIVADPCYRGGKKLAAKMNKWMKKSTDNIISNFVLTNCKRKTEDIFSSSWSKYEVCDNLYHDLIVNKLLKYPNQWSYHKEEKVK
jgi:hypothetical protein